MVRYSTLELKLQFTIAAASLVTVKLGILRERSPVS